MFLNIIIFLCKPIESLKLGSLRFTVGNNKYACLRIKKKIIKTVFPSVEVMVVVVVADVKAPPLISSDLNMLVLQCDCHPMITISVRNSKSRAWLFWGVPKNKFYWYRSKVCPETIF